jgi:lipopolysaccharide transport system permease protein
VKKIVFPLEIIPLIAFSAAIFNMLIGFVVFFVVAALLEIPVYLSSLFLPIIVLPFAFMVLGLMWFLASLGTYLRDIGHAVGLAVMLAMFLSPLFYPSEVLPADLRPVIAFNPLTFPMETARNAVLFGVIPDPLHFAAYTAIALAVMALGYSWFMATRRGFADVL